MSFLYANRKKYPALKSPLDFIRGILAYQLLEWHLKKNNTDFDRANFKRLTKWLKSTGEFNEELKSFSNWEKYFESISVEQLRSALKLTVEYADEFTNKSRFLLGEYTQNVNRFRNKAKKTYKFREDYFLARRMENEYYLNMVWSGSNEQAVKRIVC